MRKHNQVPLAQARQEITVAYADQDLAGLLASDEDACSMADVLVRARRWWTDDDARIVYAGLFHYRADRFVLDLTDDLSGGDDSSSKLIPTVRDSRAPASRRSARKSSN